MVISLINNKTSFEISNTNKLNRIKNKQIKIFKNNNLINNNKIKKVNLVNKNNNQKITMNRINIK